MKTNDCRCTRNTFFVVAFIIFAQLVAFVVLSNRGFDMTDEGFYVLNYRQWSAAPVFSFFGLYFQLPFIMVGESIQRIRVLGFLMLFVTGAWFAFEFLRMKRESNDEGNQKISIFVPALATGMAIWNYYAAIPLPYSPSYNLLALTCALCSTALALRLARKLDQDRNGIWIAFFLGFVISIGLANKFSTGICVIIINSLIIGVGGWKKTGLSTVVRLGFVFCVGMLVNVSILVLVDPDFLVRFRRGVEIQWALLPRNPLGELGRFGLFSFPHFVFSSLINLLGPISWAIVFMYAAKRMGEEWPARMTMVAIVGFVVGAMFIIYYKDRTYRFVSITLVALIMIGMSNWLQRDSLRALAYRRGAMISAAVMCMPFAYSIGTTNPLLTHMGAASIFPIAVISSQLLRLQAARFIPAWALGLCLCIMTALPAEIVARQWIKGFYTYRLGSGLSHHDRTIGPNAGHIDVTVDPRIAEGVAEFLVAVRASGFVPGQRMIDFTGQSPGLLVLCGAVPLGSLWMAGGGPFQGEKSATVALGYVDPSEIRRAWLLTSDDSISRIGSWKRVVTDRIGKFEHVKAAQFKIPDSIFMDQNKTIEITIWRPQGEI